MCSREIAACRHLARACEVDWVDAATCPPDRLGAGLSRGDALSRLHVRTADGTLISGAAAFTTLWRRLPGFAWLGGVLDHRPLLSILELGYRGVLVLRRTWRRRSP